MGDLGNGWVFVEPPENHQWISGRSLAGNQWSPINPYIKNYYSCINKVIAFGIIANPQNDHLHGQKKKHKWPMHRSYFFMTLSMVRLKMMENFMTLNMVRWKWPSYGHFGSHFRALFSTKKMTCLDPKSKIKWPRSRSFLVSFSFKNKMTSRKVIFVIDLAPNLFCWFVQS